MKTLTLKIDNALAGAMERSAKRERKDLGRWAMERLKLAAMEDTANANGYPDGWLKLFGSVPDDDRFEAPKRVAARRVNPLETD